MGPGLNPRYFDLCAVIMESLTTHLDLFVILKSQNKPFSFELLFEAVIHRLGCGLSDEDSDTLKEFCRKFTRAALQRWQRAHRSTECFRKQYEDWLGINVDWPSCVQANVLVQEPINELSFSEPSTSSSVGTMTKRSRKPFEDLGSKQKKRRSDDHKGTDSSELAHLAVIRLKEDGRDDIASVIEHMLKHPEIAAKLNEIIKKPKTSVIFTPEKALGLLLSLKLTKWQYITMREACIREDVKDLYPSYFKVQQAKVQCYPSKQSMIITDSSAKITLQDLLDITAKRILESLDHDVQYKHLTLISKWGFDGASNQNRYKQKMDSDQDDSSIFMTSLVPLKLMNGEETIWTNPKPCSALYCRPVQFTFVKESEAVVLRHKNEMDNEIKNLIPTVCNTNKVSHQLMMTMLDAKICTYLSEAKSNASCYLCLAKPTEMNNLDNVKLKSVSTAALDLGLSSLHARINMMECLLHISYRLDFKKWAAKGKEYKDMLEARKKVIQDRFKDELNLLIDIVKQGSGTTNDGNTARRFFECPDKTAEITGLDAELVRRFAVILQVITSGEQIDVNKYEAYAFKTAQMYVELYNWYHMSSTVHKILIHGADIITRNAVVPIGSLSEEASEARNKDFRRFREHNSRKKSRQASNEDILHMLILSSDPLITAMRPVLDAKKKQAMFIESLDLLKSQEPQFEFLDISNIEPDSEVDSEESDEDD